MASTWNIWHVIVALEARGQENKWKHDGRSSMHPVLESFHWVSLDWCPNGGSWSLSSRSDTLSPTHWSLAHPSKHELQIPTRGYHVAGQRWSVLDRAAYLLLQLDVGEHWAQVSLSCLREQKPSIRHRCVSLMSCWRIQGSFHSIQWSSSAPL